MKVAFFREPGRELLLSSINIISYIDTLDDEEWFQNVHFTAYVENGAWPLLYNKGSLFINDGLSEPYIGDDFITRWVDVSNVPGGYNEKINWAIEI